MLIDYEYTAINPIGWDIANYCTERNIVTDPQTGGYMLADSIPSPGEISMMMRVYRLVLTGRLSSSHALTLQSLYSLSTGSILSHEDRQWAHTMEGIFMDMMVMVSVQWILFIAVIIDDRPAWPLGGYALQRMELHKRILNRYRGG